MTKYINEYIAAFNVCVWINGGDGEMDLTIDLNNNFEWIC